MRILGPTLALPAAAALCAVALSCGGQVSPGDPLVHVGERPISRQDFELYLALNLLTDQDPGLADPNGLNRVKSRLLDALVDETTLLAEAERRGIEVSTVEIEGFLGPEREGGSEQRVSRDDRKRIVGHRLMIQRLHERVVEALPELTEDEVLAYLGQFSKKRESKTQKRVRLRALRFDDPETAAEVSKQIAARKTSFAEAVVNYETGPGQGLLVEMSTGGFSDELRHALAELRPGEVSRPVEFNGDPFLFQLESWVDDPAESGGERVARARDELERQRRRRAESGLLQKLRNQTSVEIHLERLRFEYLPEA